MADLPGKKINELDPAVAAQFEQVFPVGYLNSPGTEGVSIQQLYNLFASLDTDLQPDTNEQVPTQRAVKTYVDGINDALLTLIGLNELLSNKSTNTALGSSNTLYPSQNAVKTYVDTVAALREVLTNKSSNTSLGGSNDLYPTQNAVKTYVDTAISNVNASTISTYDELKTYTAGELVYFTSATVKGLFVALDAIGTTESPESATGYDKWKPISVAWVQNNFTADDLDYFIDLGGKRTGTITYTDSLPTAAFGLIVLNGYWAASAGKQLTVTQVGGSGGSAGAATFLIEYLGGSSQINIYFTPGDDYTAGSFKINFELKS